MTEYVPFHRCYGRNVVTEMVERLARSGGEGYISPEEKDFEEKLRAQAKDGRVGYTCKWPMCPCPSSSVSGVHRKERFAWIIEQARKDPKFTVRDIPFNLD